MNKHNQTTYQYYPIFIGHVMLYPKQNKHSLETRFTQVK